MAASRSPIKLDAASLESQLKQNRRDTDRRPIPELGYSMSAWTGGEVSFAATIGAWSKYVGNAVVLDLDTESDFGQDCYQRILKEAVHAFDPDHAVVTSHEHLRRAAASRPWEAGLFTYRRGGQIELHAFE